MAPISAITATRIYSVSQAREANEQASVKDEFSALFEDYVPGFEVSEGEDFGIDTSMTVAPLRSAVQPTEVHDVQSETLSSGEPVEETAAYSDHGEANDYQMHEQQGTLSQEAARDNQSQESEEAQVASEDVDVSDSQNEPSGGAGAAHVVSQGPVSDDSVPSDKIQVDADVVTVGESNPVPGPATSTVVEDVEAESNAKEPAGETLDSGAQTKAPVVGGELSKVSERGEKPQNLAPIVKEAPPHPATESVVDPSTTATIENPVFGAMKSEGDELTKVFLSKQETHAAKGGGAQVGASTRGASPLLEVLMNQVQRLSAQGVSISVERPELNLGSRSMIQLGQAQGAASIGPSLSTRAETESRPAKISRQAAASGVRTMERVQKALADGVAAQDGKTISLRLDPPELGRVKVDLSYRSGNLSARIVAESASVTSLLRERAHELQHTLRKLGLEANNVTVSISHDSGQGESKANFDGERRREQFERGTLEQEMVESVLVEEQSEEGKVAVDHRVA